MNFKLRAWKVYLFLLVNLSIHRLAAQEEEIQLNDLKSPSFPAGSIIGLEDQVISRPTDRSVLQASLLTSIKEGGNVEFTPYWLSNRKNLTFNDYIAATGETAFYQTLSFSLATSNFDSLTLGRKYSIGTRFQVVPGRLNEKVKKLSRDLFFEASLDALLYSSITGMANPLTSANAIIDVTNQINATAIPALIMELPIGTTMTEYITYLTTKGISNITNLINNNPPNAGEAVNDYAIRLIGIKNQNSTEKVLELQESISQRVGWIWEIAGATGFQGADDNLKDLSHLRSGVWSTLTHRSDSGKVDKSLMFRYLGQNDSLSNTIDFGGKINISNKDYSLNLELLGRYLWGTHEETNAEGMTFDALDEDFSWRLALNLDYRVANALAFSITVGKNYNEPLSIETQNNLLLLFGLKLSPVKKLPRQ